MCIALRLLDIVGELRGIGYQFLWRRRAWLQLGGQLVWMVPQHLLQFRKAAG